MASSGRLLRLALLGLLFVVVAGCIEASPTQEKEVAGLSLTPVLVTEFSPTTAPFATPVWEDISDRVYRLRVSRGKSSELGQFSAGTATYELDNHDRLFDPNYAAGDYFGNLKPRRRIRTLAIAGPVVEAPNGTRYVISVATDSSLTTTVTEAVAASPTIVVDDSSGQGWEVGIENDGTLRTDTTASAEANVPVLQDADGVKWLVGVTTAGELDTNTTSNAATGVSEYLFTGFVDGWPQAYNPPGDSTVTLSATDGFKILARTPLTSGWEQQIRSDSPKAWWRLGETRGTDAQDSSDNGHHGTYEGGVTFNTREGLIFGDPDGAIEFTSSSQRVTVPPTLIDSYPFTIEGWFRVEEDTTGNRILAMFASDHTVPIDYVFVYIAQTDDKLYAGVQGGGDTRMGVSSATVNDNQPHHFALVATSANDIELYLDGVVQTVQTLGSGTPTIAEDHVAGSLGNKADVNISGDPLDGILDDVVIYDTALSAATVSDHYDAGNAPWDEDSPATRIGRILDQVGWPAADRDIDTGRALLGPFEATDSALQALQDVARAEGGRSMLYIDGAGKLVFRARSDFWTTARYNTSNGTFGDGAGELVFDAANITIEHDDSDIINRVRIAPNTGWFQQVDDATSQTETGATITHEERILEKRSAYALHAAEYTVARKKDDHDRLPTVELDPEEDPDALYPVILDADFGYRYTFKRRPQGIGDAISIDVHLEHVSHDITPGSWTTRWQLSPVEADAFRWDSGDGSRFGWDNGSWAY